MSGHSHWATTHRQKGINDAKKGVLFTKAGRDITIAAQKGGDPDKNFMLRMAIDAARAVNLPKENIERAIKRGTGELKDGAKIEEIVYEGFGPGHVALLIETATDNKNRTVSEIKSLFTKNNLKLGNVGSVAFLFGRVGLLVFSLEQYTSEALEEAALDSGALDFKSEEENFVVFTKMEDLQKVREFFVGKNFTPESAKLGYAPHQTVTLPEKELEVFQKFYELLDEHPDVQVVWSNLA